MTSIHVFADWEGLPAPVPIGSVYADRRQGKGGGEVFSFAFEDDFLGLYRAGGLARGLVLDPNIGMWAGRQYAPDGKLFGMLSDASPDRWGRVLMERRLASDKRKGLADNNKILCESDFLLGVHDAYRLGALRFKRNPDGPFLDDSNNEGAPPVTHIQALIETAHRIEQDLEVPDEWVGRLIAPGASLGGARPKALVKMEDGSIMLAKFPSTNDRHNVGAWEWVTAQLAQQCGISVTDSRARQFASAHHTFLTPRFDRAATGARLHFASAMTLTGKQDGEEASYLDIVEAIQQYSGSADADLADLWCRMVFNILVSNCDDHLRNHGFLYHPGMGWRLAPAYDMNPVPGGMGLQTNINEYENALNLDLAMDVVKYFRIQKDVAATIVSSMIEVVGNWRAVAGRGGLSQSEMDRMAPAFHV